MNLILIGEDKKELHFVISVWCNTILSYDSRKGGSSHLPCHADSCKGEYFKFKIWKFKFKFKFQRFFNMISLNRRIQGLHVLCFLLDKSKYN